MEPINRGKSYAEYLTERYRRKDIRPHTLFGERVPRRRKQPKPNK